MRRVFPICYISMALAILLSCETDIVVVDGNTPYSTFNISDIKIENYVNRLYIDIVGREPLDDELVTEVNRLKVQAPSSAKSATASSIN
jgi:hypothetical protein